MTAGLDLGELAKVGRALLGDGPLTRPALRDRLAARWPAHEAEALAWSVQALVPVLHPPPNGLWRRGGATPFVLAEDWLGAPVETEPDPGALVRRYLAMVAATVLVDGAVRGTWKLRWDKARGAETATLSVDLFERLSRADRDAVAAEAHRLLDFAAATSDARIVVLPG